MSSTFTATLHDATPHLIVNSLKKRFEEVHALEMEILSTEYSGARPQSPHVPVSVTVCAQGVTSSDGRSRAEAWFKSHDAV